MNMNWGNHFCNSIYQHVLSKKLLTVLKFDIGSAYLKLQCRFHFGLSHSKLSPSVHEPLKVIYLENSLLSKNIAV